MKKSLKVIIALSVIVIVLVGCNNKKENEIITNNENINTNTNTDTNTNNNNIVVESTPVNTTYDTEDAFNSIENISSLDETTKLQAQQLEEEFEFNEYNVLEKEIRSKITENSITEIGIIKLGNIGQTEKVMEIALKRKAALDAKYAENPEIMEILDNSDNFVLKQEGGIVKYIIASNASSIEI